MKYAVLSDDDEWIYPFAKHQHWMHWIQNTVERHRFQGQKNVFMDKCPEYRNMSDSDLEKIINENGEELQRMLSKMQMYSSNILGSNAYFYKRRTELQALMEQEGMCRICENTFFENIDFFFSP